MPKKGNNVLKYNHGENFIIYVDMEFLLEKISICHNNPKKSSRTKININIHPPVIHCLHIAHLMFK